MNHHDTNDSRPIDRHPEWLCRPDARQLGTIAHRALDWFFSFCSAYKKLREYQRNLDPGIGKVFAGYVRERIVKSIPDHESVFAEKVNDLHLMYIFSEAVNAYIEVSDGTFEWLGLTYSSAHEAALRTTSSLSSHCIQALESTEGNPNVLFSTRFVDHLERNYPVTPAETTRIRTALKFEEHRATEKGLVLKITGEFPSCHVTWSFHDSGAGVPQSSGGRGGEDSEPRNEEGFVEKPLDESSYVPFTDIYTKHNALGATEKQLRKHLKDNLNGVRQWRPRSNRRCVNLIDWLSYQEAVKGKSRAQDAEPTPEEIEERKDAIRSRKQRGQ